jgi:hypothetical protein
LAPLSLARRENAKQVLWKVLPNRFQMFGRIASKKQSSPFSDQLMAFEFPIKLLDDFGVELRMKMVHHGKQRPPKLLEARLSSYFRQFKHLT